MPTRVSAPALAGCLLALAACSESVTATRSTDLGRAVDVPSASDAPDALGDDVPATKDAPATDLGDDLPPTTDAATDDVVVDAAAPSDAGVAVALAGPCTDAADAVYVTPAGLPTLTPERRGDVVRCATDPAQSVAAVNGNLRAANVDGVTATYPVDVYRIAFRTYRNDVAEGLSSARVYLPHGVTGPRPMVVVAHPSEGLADNCAPSRRPDTLRDVALPWATQGYPVIAPDYAGLGTDGTQGYLDNRDTAQSLLDGARALRRLLAPGSLSSRIVLVGYSQGGGAVIAAQGLARTYGADGDIAAVVAYAPEWPSRLNSFQLISALRNPDALTISYGVTTPAVVTSMAYAFYENHVGRGRGAEALPAAVRATTPPAIDSLCLVAYGGYVQGLQLRVRDWLDPTLRMGFLACADAPTGAACTGPGRAFYEHVRANVDTWGGGAGDGAPIFYVQGMLDTIIPPAQEAACNLLRLQRAGASVEVCTDEFGLHSTVVERNARRALAWVAGRLDGRDVAPCNGPAMPACAP